MKWSTVFAVGCVALLALNIALVRQNRQLKAQLSGPAPGMEATSGAPVPDLRGFDVSGQPLTVAYGQDSRPVLVFVFSPTCAFCEQNWPKWYGIIAAMDREAVRPVAVDVTSTATQDFLVQHQLAGMPVLLKVDPAIVVGYRFQLTPQTILIDRSGKVEKVWSGVLSDSSLAEIKRKVAGNKPVAADRGSRAVFR